MPEIMGLFVSVVPRVEIVDGLVHISGPRGELVCTPGVLRGFLDRVRFQLNAWDRQRIEPAKLALVHDD